MLLNILLQMSATGGKAGGWQGILMMVLVFVIFYFFLIRPQSKRQKEIRKFQDNLASGSQVVTAGGIYGKVKNIEGNTIMVEIAKDVVIKVNKAMVNPVDEQKELEKRS